MNLDDIPAKMARRESAEQIENEERFQPNNSNTITYFTSLPDELLLLVLSYLNIVDIFQAFHGLNQRFNNLIYDCAQHITLPHDVTNPWIEQNIPQFEYRVKTLCLNAKSLQFVFANTWSFPNLQLINLEGKGWNMSLRTRGKPAAIILMSSLNFLQNSSPFINTFFLNTKNVVLSDEDNYWKTLSCPFIEYLSINICFLENLIAIGTRAPNLIHLKINCLQSRFNEIHFINEFDLIKRMTRLVTLNITTEKMTDFNILEQLIKSFQRFLRNLTLNVHSFHPIDGRRLEETFKSCQKLKKFAFFLEFKTKYFDRHSFRSEWWLDERRPLVYIQHNHADSTIITSIPSQCPFTFKNSLYDWYVNKVDTNASLVRFDNINKIHLTNNVHQLISLKYLYSIDRTFTSSNQCLCFDFCDLESVDILFYMLTEDPSMTPVLPNVKHFIVGSKNKLDSLMLCVWILLAPNLQKLDISKLTVFNKLELAKELNDMIDSDKRLEPNFNHINELIIFSEEDNADTETKNNLLVTFQKVFIRTVIS